MNVVVYIADSLRPDYMGCYGNDWIQTPNWGAFAKNSTLFTRAYSEGMPTLPCRTAMFTGRYTFPFTGWQKLDTEHIALAEHLWNNEVVSALVTDVHHLHKPTMGYERGFDTVKFIRGQEGDPYKVNGPLRAPVEDYWKGCVVTDEHVKKYPGATKLSAENFRNHLEQYLRNTADFKTEEDWFAAQVAIGAMNWLEDQKKRDRLFLWIDSFDPHEPWDPPPNYIDLYMDRNPGYTGKHIIHPIPMPVDGYLTEEEEADIRNLYAASVTYADKWFGEFMNKLDELKMLDDTMVIFTSDHGEPLGSGIHGHGIIRKARSWPYEQLGHIPLIVYHPDGQKGAVTDAFAQTPDVFPTVTEALGVENPPDQIHADSLLPIVKGEKESDRDFAVTCCFKEAWKIRDDKYSFILWYPDPTGEIDPPSLFDLENDPWEQTNIIDQHPDFAQKLQIKLRRFVDSLT